MHHLDDAVRLFLSGYFATCRRSLKTKAAYSVDLAQFERHLGAATSLDVIEPVSLEGWAKVLIEQGYAAVSVRRKFAALRVFFTYWVRRGVLNASPLWRIRLDLNTERRLPRALSSADAQRLIERAWTEVPELPPTGGKPSDHRFLAFRNVAAVELLFATGIRVGELVSLDLGDWDAFDQSFRVKGKGSRQRVAVLPDGRSAACIKTYLSRRTAMTLGHEGLFVNAAGSRLTTQGVARALAIIAAAAGVETKITPHMLRHTVATLLLRNGADIRVVQEVLGHSSISMTERYTHVSKEHLRSTLQAHHPNNHQGFNVPWLGA
jgi:site-specific recombinase XerD